MFSQYENPSSLLPFQLDNYLACGWFRMGQIIFTSNFLHFNEQFYSAIWLRVCLKEEITDKAFIKLKKLNKHFRVEIRPAIVTEEKEALFEIYKTAIPFDAADSLKKLLYKETEPYKNIYNTREVCIYDGEQMIACGFFDLGDKSAAGISSFYNPNYKKYSLGKYLIYLKIAYCQQQGFDYFYPGYFTPNYTAFDYKLQMANEQLEYFDLYQKQWFSIDQFNQHKSPWHETQTKLQNLSNALSLEALEHTLFKYAFYDINLFPQFQGYELFDYPVLLYCFEYDEARINPIVVYDVCTQLYHLVRCMSIGKANEAYGSVGYYAAQILKIKQVIYSTDDADEMVKMLTRAKVGYSAGTS